MKDTIVSAFPYFNLCKYTERRNLGWHCLDVTRVTYYWSSAPHINLAQGVRQSRSGESRGVGHHPDNMYRRKKKRYKCQLNGI